MANERPSYEDRSDHYRSEAWQASRERPTFSSLLSQRTDPYRFHGIPLWCLSLIICLTIAPILFSLALPTAILSIRVHSLLASKAYNDHATPGNLTLTIDTNGALSSTVLNYAVTRTRTVSYGTIKSTMIESYTLIPTARGIALILSSNATPLKEDDVFSQYYAPVLKLTEDPNMLPDDWGHANYVEDDHGDYHYKPRTPKSTNQSPLSRAHGTSNPNTTKGNEQDLTIFTSKSSSPSSTLTIQSKYDRSSEHEEIDSLSEEHRGSTSNLPGPPQGYSAKATTVFATRTSLTTIQHTVAIRCSSKTYRAKDGH